MAAPKGQPKPPGSGRKKGTLNKSTATIKEMVIEALDRAGGVEYLLRQAEGNPGPFLTLVGKILPTQITGADGGPVRISVADAIRGAGREVKD